YRLKDNDGRYAVPLAVAPALVVTPDWKSAAYRWFKSARPGDPVPVFAESVSAEERRAFSMAYTELPRELPRQPLPEPPALQERMETDRITVTGCRPGHPVLIRISYHPRWKVTTGERVWLAAPSFMLVVPKGERIELYGAGRLAEAVPLFERARRLAPLSMSAIHSTYFEGMSLYRQEQWAEAARVFTDFVTTFPEAQAAAESMYHLGLCRARLGNQAGAV